MRKVAAMMPEYMHDFDESMHELLDKQTRIANRLRIGLTMLAVFGSILIATAFYLLLNIEEKVEEPGVQISDADVIETIRVANIAAEYCGQSNPPLTYMDVRACVERILNAQN